MPASSPLKRARAVLTWSIALALASAGAIVTAPPAAAAPWDTTFVGKPGSNAPPSTLGPYEVTAFGADSRPDGQMVTRVAAPSGALTFDQPVKHTRIGTGWSTWSHGYTGDVYERDASTLTITLPAGTKGFYFYAEPNQYKVISVRATTAGGTGSGPVNVQGRSGARYFGFVTTGAKDLSSVVISTDDTAFAVGEFGIVKAAQRGLIAMGDSYSSGEGNPPFLAGTDSGRDTCHRSTAAWPNTISSASPTVHLVTSIACSGAEMSAMTTSFKTEAPQLDQLAAAPSTALITVTLGGNDIGFADILTSCFVGDCRNDIKSATFNATRAHGLGYLLTRTYRQIQQQRPQSRLVVVGYPNIFPTSQASAVNCGWLTDQERPALVDLATTLDTVIKKAAQDAGAEYVSTLTAVSGHELCTADSWMYPIGFSGGQLRGHPVAAGQQAIAGVVAGYLATR